MENVLLIRYGEIHLKGLNRPYFERILIERIKNALRGFSATVQREQGRIYVFGVDPKDNEYAITMLRRVFGIHSVSPALAVDKNWDAICECAKIMMLAAMGKTQAKTFKVFARRSDKRFNMNSLTICAELGHVLLNEFEESHGLSVNVTKPDISITVEIREQAYIYTEDIPCAGGMPTGTSGRGMLLLSGGIDSPVAGYMLAKRGLELSAIHFYSYPYTSVRARDKVIELAKILATHTGEIRLYLVPFTEIQLAIYDKCPSKETTVIMRRLMMKIAERVAENDGARVLITGEALAQVASQTLESLCVTDDAVQMPVFRPLIGFDKEEITVIARKIDTFETSILPYEDCCTVFVPQHPVTRPSVKAVRKNEALVDFSDMIEKAIADTELVVVD